MNTNNHYDVIVVGSGAGGSAAVYQLAHAGLRVLLIDKGKSLPTDGSTLDINKVVHRGEFKSKEIWRDGRGSSLTPEEYFNLGGKTKWYGAALARFSDHEFEEDKQHQCSAWPFPAAELKPYYELAENLLGVAPFACETDLARLVQRLQSNGSGWETQPLPMGLRRDIVSFPQEAKHFDGFASPRGLKGDGEQNFLAAVRGKENLHLHTGDAVVQLVSEPSRPNDIVGVKTMNGRVFSARMVVLAAGALHSPRLLERYLRNQELRLPVAANIGRNLKLHLLTAVLALSIHKQQDLLRKTRLLLHPDVPHSSVQPLGFDAELLSTLIPTYVPRFAAMRMGARAYGFFLQTEDGSSPLNRIVCEGGEFAVPTLDYDAARLPPAQAEHQRLVRLFRRSLFKAGFINFAQTIGLQGTAHACGTLRAGRDASESVVDGDGRVHGMNGLMVVDGSVLPRSSRVNPALSIYAFSLRASARLAQRLHSESAMEICL